MIGMIAAVGKNLELGKNNGLIWNLPNDLKFFRSVTTGKIVVMGKNTFNSLPKLLPSRKHIILSDDNNFNKKIEDSIVFHEKEKLLNYLKDISKTEDVYIIGGASMYTIFIDMCDFMYLTEISAEDKNADVYFPKFIKTDWEKYVIAENEDNGIKYTHVKYVRKK